MASTTCLGTATTTLNLFSLLPAKQTNKQINPSWSLILSANVYQAPTIYQAEHPPSGKLQAPLSLAPALFSSWNKMPQATTSPSLRRSPSSPSLSSASWVWGCPDPPAAIFARELLVFWCLPIFQPSTIFPAQRENLGGAGPWARTRRGQPLGLEG